MGKSLPRFLDILLDLFRRISQVDFRGKYLIFCKIFLKCMKTFVTIKSIFTNLETVHVVGHIIR